MQKIGNSRTPTIKYQKLREEESPRERYEGYDIAGNNDPKSMLLPRNHK